MVANPQRDDIHSLLKQRYEHISENSIQDRPGIIMNKEAFEHMISIESSFRYEMVEEIVYDMTGSEPEHSIIVSNIETLIRKQIGRGGPYRVYRDQYVFIPDRPSVIPDVVLTCDPLDWDKNKWLQPFKVLAPLIAVEVLSPDTQCYDRTEKFARYKLCPTLEVYILVSQYEPHVEVYQRVRDWQQEHYGAGQIIQFDQLDLELAVDAIYEGVLS